MSSRICPTLEIVIINAVQEETEELFGVFLGNLCGLLHFQKGAVNVVGGKWRIDEAFYAVFLIYIFQRLEFV